MASPPDGSGDGDGGGGGGGDYTVGQVLIGYYCTGDPRYYRIVKVTPRQVHVRRCYIRSIEAHDDWRSRRVVYGGRVDVPASGGQTYGSVIRGAKRDQYAICDGLACVPYQPDTDPYEYSTEIQRLLQSTFAKRRAAADERKRKRADATHQRKRAAIAAVTTTTTSNVE